MGYKHHAMDIARTKSALSAPNFLLKLGLGKVVHDYLR